MSNLSFTHSQPSLIFDDLFMKFMENISDETISFHEYKNKWEENKRLSFQNLPETSSILQEKFNSTFSSSTTASHFEQFSKNEEISKITLQEFINKYHVSPISDFQYQYKDCILLRFSSKSMILLFISILHFKRLFENLKNKIFEDLIKKLEFFKYQVSRVKQLKLIEIFKNLKNRIENNYSASAFHSFINFLISDKVFREGVVELMQEIMVDLVLNSNFHHIIQNRNIELKRFILQLRNSKNEDELLTEEVKTLISKCFAVNFNISHLNISKNSISKESFVSKPKNYEENFQETDVFNQKFLDFIVLSQEKIEANTSYVIMREQDYETFFLTKIYGYQANQADYQKKDSNLLNKENFERKFSINFSNISHENKDSKGFQTPKESLKKKSIETRLITFGEKVSNFTLKKMQSLMVNLLEDSKNLERLANF